MFACCLSPFHALDFEAYFAPTSQSRRSKKFRDSEPLGKSAGKKWSQSWTFLLGSGLKWPCKKKFFFYWFCLTKHGGNHASWWIRDLWSKGISVILAYLYTFWVFPFWIIFFCFYLFFGFVYSWSTLLWYRCYYPHRSRDSVSPVYGIFSKLIFSLYLWTWFVTFYPFVHFCKTVKLCLSAFWGSYLVNWPTLG